MPKNLGLVCLPKTKCFYFQVDFLRPMKIEGIEILNWEESGYLTNASRYSPYIKGMGVSSFTVEYSQDASELRHFQHKQVVQ